MSRRRMSPLFAIACAILVAGCAHQAPTAKTATDNAPAAKKTDAKPDFPPPKPAESEGPKLVFAVPPGWEQKPPPENASPRIIGAVVHSSDGKTLDGMVVLFMEKSDGSLADAVAKVTKEVAGDGGSSKRLSATDTLIVFGWSGMKSIPGMQGKYAAYRSKQYSKVTITMIAYWKPADDAAMSQAFDLISGSMEVK